MKGTGLVIILFWVLQCFAIPEISKARVAEDPTLSKCFSKSYSDPLELFEEAYEASRVLGWGLTNHVDFRPIELLEQFLDVIGKDERLVYLFVEWPAIANELFKKMSLSGTAADDDLVFLLGPHSRYFSSPLRLDQIQGRVEFERIYKKVSHLNKSRKNKLIIVPIDAGLGPHGEETFPVLSFDRELHTSDNFNRYLSDLNFNQKALVLYHTYHLARNIVGTSYRDRRIPIQSPLGFMGLSEIKNSEFQLIVFDSPALIEHSPWKRLFQYPYVDLPNHVLLNSQLALERALSPFHGFRLGKQSSFGHCLNANNFYQHYSRGARMPDPLSKAFQYLVWLN